MASHRNNSVLASFEKLSSEVDLIKIWVTKMGPYEAFEGVRQVLLNPVPLLKYEMKAVRTLRILLQGKTNHTEVTNSVIKWGVVGKLLKYLKWKDPQVNFDAICSLASVTFGSDAQIRTVVKAGAVPVLIQILQTSWLSEIVDPTIITLWNISDVPENQKLLLEAGILPPVLKWIEQYTESNRALKAHSATFKCNLRMIYYLTGIISSLQMGVDSRHVPFAMSVRIIQLFSRILSENKYTGILKTVLCTLANILCDTFCRHIRIKRLVNSGCSKKLVELLSHDDHTIVRLSSKLLMNVLSSGREEILKAILECGLLPKVVQLMQHSSNHVVGSACSIICNVAIVPDYVSEIYEEAQLIPNLIRVLTVDDTDNQYRATWALNNIVWNSSVAQVEHLVEQGALKALIYRLNDSELDPQLEILKVDTLKRLLWIGRPLKKRQPLWVERVSRLGGIVVLDKLMEMQLDWEDPTDLEP